MQTLKRMWDAIAAKIIQAETVALFSLIYFILFVPMSLIWRKFGKKRHAGWHRWEVQSDIISDLQQQG